MPRPTPLFLVATMLALGVAIEIVAFGGPIWLPKLPLALLLTLAFARARPHRGRA